jgi:hypothetical protein
MELDLLIQDFVSTNRMNSINVSWDTMVSRLFEDGRRKIAIYGSGKVAIGEHLTMSDGEWLCITLAYDMSGVKTEDLRFDCLKMMCAKTHYDISVNENTVRLLTKNRGLFNVMFRFIPSVDPWHCGCTKQ